MVRDTVEGTKMARTTEEVYLDHVSALGSGDFGKLLDDYADDAVLMTLNMSFTGKEGVAAFFQGVMEAYPGLVITAGPYAVSGDYLLATWSAESDVATVDAGVDTFVVHDDRIQLQTVWFPTPVPK
jgi:ketosteroid isomerase-like protein